MTRRVQGSFSLLAALCLTAALALLSGGCVSPGAATLARGAGARPDHVVLISIDGCRPEYLGLAPMPHLHELEARGTTYTGAWCGLLASNTPPAHTSMSTGTFPRRHNIVGFYWFDSETGERIEPTSRDAIAAGDFARIVRESGVPTLSALSKAQDPAGKIVAVTSQKVYAVQGLGVGPADVIVYAVPAGGARDAETVPGIAAELDRGYEAPARGAMVPAAVRGHEPPAGLLDGLALEARQPGDADRFSTDMALRLFAALRPRILFHHLPSADEFGHETGGLIAPETMAEVMRAVDGSIGRIVAAYRDAGLLDRTLFVITADHGMTPNTHRIDPAVLAAPAHSLGVRVQGRPPFWFLDPPARAPELAEAIARERIDGVVAVYAKVRTGDGRYEYRIAPASQAMVDPVLDRTYRYLLGTFVGRYSPDVIAATAENTGIGTEPANTHGVHNQLTWANQHVPLVLAGPGIRRGARSSLPARLVDIAPTIAGLMGWPAGGMDGVALADALAEPTAADRDAQDSALRPLVELRDALAKQAR